jgi:hypothetical protein
MDQSRNKRALKSLLYGIVTVSALGCAPASSAPSGVFTKDDFQLGLDHTRSTWVVRKSGKVPDLHFDYAGRIDVAPGDEQNGNKSFRFEWRQADSDGTNPTRHAELITPSFPYATNSSPKLEQWLGFRIYVDSKTLGPDEQPVVLMQYHDTPGRDANGKPTETGRNPMAALSYVNGEFRYGWKGDTKQVTTKDKNGKWIYTQQGGFPLVPARQGWNTFVFHHMFDYTGKGSVEIWCNDKYFTRHNIQLGFNDDVGPYLKFGFYWYTGRSVPNPPVPNPARVVWFDDVKIGDAKATYADVRPPGAQETAPRQVLTN